MKKRLILTILIALLFGACSNQNEASQKETEKQVGFVQKEEKAKKERDEQEKAEKEKKAKEEQERKEQEEREKKAKEEQERKEKEEREKKEAEAKQLAEQAESYVQQLENNQIQDNVAPAQAAVEQVVDPTVKATLTERIGRVQNAINEKAKVEAQQAAAAQQAQQQQAFVTQPQQGGYRNCSEARAAGAAPLRRGQPGYSARLDRDGDGIACE